MSQPTSTFNDEPSMIALLESVLFVASGPVTIGRLAQILREDLKIYAMSDS